MPRDEPLALSLAADKTWKKKMLGSQMVTDRLRKIRNPRMDRDEILDSLYLYCNPREKVMKLIWEEATHRRRQVEGLIRKIQKLDTAIEAIAKDHSSSGLGLTPGVHYTDVRDELRKYLVYLKDIRLELKLQGNAKGKGRYEHGLACLALEIERETGKQHYQELADLVSEGYRALGLEEYAYPEDIRKRIQRYIQKNPEIQDMYEP